MRISVLLGVMTSLLVLHSSTPAQENTYIIHHSTILNEWGGSCDIAVEGNYAFIAAPRTGLRILDVSDPSAPVLAGFFQTGQEVLRINVINDICYVLCFPSTLKIIDVSDPSDPELVGTWQHVGDGAVDFTLSEFYAYVIFDNDDGDNFFVIDLSDISNPETVGITSTGINAYFIEIQGDYVYLSNTQNGLAILDVSSPDNPFESGSLTSSINVYDLQIAGDYAYMASDNGLLIVDIWDPARPIIIINIGIEGLKDVVLSGTDLFITGERSALIDISIPGYPAITYTVDHEDKGCGIASSNGNAFIFLETGSIVVSDLSYWPRNENDGRYESSGITTAIDYSDSYLYANGPVAGSETMHNLRIFDVSNHISPQALGVLPVSDMIYDLAVKDDYAFVAYTDSEAGPGTHGIQIIDISDPVTPEETANIVLESAPLFGVTVNTDYLFTGTADNGFTIINISDIEYPVVEGYDSFGPYTDMSFTVFGDYAIVTGDTGNQQAPLRVLDLYNPAEIEEVTRNNYITRIVPAAVSGDYAYLVHEGLTIYNISDPDYWELVASNDEVTGDFISVSGNYAFMADRNEKEIYAFDIGVTHNPILAGSHNLSGDVRDLVSNDVFAYVADTWFTEIFEYSEEYGLNPVGRIIPQEFTVSSPYPNPFNSTVTLEFFLPQDGKVEYKVFDLLGRELVKSNQFYPAGSQRIQYRIEPAGYHPGSGIYLMQLNYNGNSVIKRSLYLK
ncbi:MAG: T9SS type A sorting domain-containing protein [Candidatus Electryonea clarkiae]|nr:T9SS type A sorting domain-containing protein [Candidatus Electryonea clarkiae]MDP8289073.1 T9SS type A sorting domain-containing protein [Candidatus Electryonea clarkiae]